MIPSYLRTLLDPPEVRIQILPPDGAGSPIFTLDGRGGVRSKRDALAMLFLALEALGVDVDELAEDALSQDGLDAPLAQSGKKTSGKAGAGQDVLAELRKAVLSSFREPNTRPPAGAMPRGPIDMLMDMPKGIPCSDPECPFHGTGNPFGPTIPGRSAG